MSAVGHFTDPGRAMIKHGFLVCCSLNNGRTLLRRRRRPPCAKSGFEQAQQDLSTELLLNHLVGAGEHRGWDGQAKRLGSLEIDR